MPEQWLAESLGCVRQPVTNESEKCHDKFAIAANRQIIMVLTGL